MILKLYDYQTGDVISDAVGLYFGKVYQGQHCVFPVVARIFPTTETTITDSSVFLTSTYGNAEFGYYFGGKDFTSNINAGTLPNHFTVSSDATVGSLYGTPLQFYDATSEYMWLDVEAPTNLQGYGESSYRLLYNFS